MDVIEYMFYVGFMEYNLRQNYSLAFLCYILSINILRYIILCYIISIGFIQDLSMVLLHAHSGKPTSLYDLHLLVECCFTKFIIPYFNAQYKSIPSLDILF